VSSTWRKLVGEGALIGLGAFCLVWFLHIVAAPHGIYLEAEAKGKNALSRSDAQNLQLQTQIRVLQAQVTDYEREFAVRDAVVNTLQTQNRDQQTTIKRLVDDIKPSEMNGLSASACKKNASSSAVKNKPK